MTIHYRQQGQAIIIFGNTYPFRDQIKSLGGRFQGAEKTWRLPLSDTALTLVAELCQRVGGGALAPPLEAIFSAELTGSTELTPETLPLALDDPNSLPNYTIRQLMETLGLAVKAAFPASVWVTGEVQNLSRRASGVFFDLAEGRSGGHANSTVAVKAVLWGGTLQEIAARRGSATLTDVLQDGMEVRCLCQVQLYKDRGQVSLVVEDLDPAFTRGALALAREKLLKELRAKGLDQAQKRLPLPPFPFRVGLISAEGSRAKSDFLDQLFSFGFPGTVWFCAARMQGEGVTGDVVHALQCLAKERVDIIVLTRGGGSAADLRWFDAPEIAYAIAACPVPVVAAIGHHDDVSIAEDIAFIRQKTPTAAADFIAQIFAETREKLEGLAATLAKTLSYRVDEFSQLTSSLVERLKGAADHGIQEKKQAMLQRGADLKTGALSRILSQLAALAQTSNGLSREAERTLAALQVQTVTLEAALGRMDPRPWIAQGWTQLCAKVAPVRRAQQAQVGEQLRARLADGWLELEVKGIKAFADLHSENTANEKSSAANFPKDTCHE